MKGGWCINVGLAAAARSGIAMAVVDVELWTWQASLWGGAGQRGYNAYLVSYPCSTAGAHDWREEKDSGRSWTV